MINKYFLGRSGLYYRNTLLILIGTVIIFTVVFVLPARWTVFFFFPAILLIFLSWNIYFSVHPWRPFFIRRLFKPEPYQRLKSINYTSADGLVLQSYFLPGTNRKAVILLHGHGSSGMSMIAHARMLEKAGYGVLMPDLRAHGASDGDTVGGAAEVKDVQAAINYLKIQYTIDPECIGMLGVSFGALVALRSTVQCEEIKAVVLESIGPASLEDHGGRPDRLIRWLNYPINWFIYMLMGFMTAARVGGVVDALQRLEGIPVLFISAGHGKEQYFTRIFHKAARPPKFLWEASRSMHGITLAVEKDQYTERVVGFFDRNL